MTSKKSTVFDETSRQPCAAPSGALLIGYGNPLRRDDGLGPHIAAVIQELGLPKVRTRIVHQLAPEMAEELSTASRAVFVDASIESTANGVTVKPLEPGGAIGVSHAFDPQLLLCLAQTLFGHAPRAWLIQVAGDDFGAGEGLSAAASRRSERAVQITRNLLGAVGKK
jgi:hydrogenase maturation protease